MIRDNEVHRREYIENGSPEAVWNQRIWIRPDKYSIRAFKQGLY